jgi:hypothetical protein
LGLLYLGQTEKADTMLEAVRTVEHKRGKYLEVTLETCAYAGSGNVLKVQKLLKSCAERLTENAEHQAVAVIGIALTVVGEEVCILVCIVMSNSLPPSAPPPLHQITYWQKKYTHTHLLKYYADCFL